MAMLCSRRKAANVASRDVDLAAPLAAATVAAAVLGGIGWAVNRPPLAAAGLLLATALAGAFAVYLIVSERRRHELAEDELQHQASFLESLVEAIAAVSRASEADEVLARVGEEAKRLFHAGSVRLLDPKEPGADEARIDGGRMLVPVAVRERRLGTLELTRAERFHRWDVVRATVLADFAARAVENARLLAEAREREAERALIHDAALAAVREGRFEDAAKLIETSLERERNTIRELRDLSFAIEPLVLRDQGFHAAVRALGDQIEQSDRITVSTNVGVGERLGEKTRAALYQIIREAVNQAVRRNPDNIQVGVGELDDGGYAIEIADDGVGERRRASIESIEERVRVLNGRCSVEHGDDSGTMVRVVIPGYVAAVDNEE